MLVGLWLTPFYIHTLGVRDYGIWLVGLQVLNFLLLCDFGIIVVTPRDVAQRQRHRSTPSVGQRSKVARVVGQTLKVVLAQTGVIALAALALFLLRPAHDASTARPRRLDPGRVRDLLPAARLSGRAAGLAGFEVPGPVKAHAVGHLDGVVIVMLLLGARFYALACGWCLQQMGHDLVAFIRLRRVSPRSFVG